jgi:acyl-CoA synthetase (AMP-forming)/AMP-acid ligase II
MILLDNGPSFIASFFSVLFIGSTVVGVNPKSSIDRILDIAASADSTVILTSADLLPGLQSLKKNEPFKKILLVEDLVLAKPPSRFTVQDVAPNDTVFLQFTSGTTGNSKGVMLSHTAVLANLKGISSRVQVDPQVDICSSFLPLYHDMGLIGFCLFPIYAGVQLILYRQDIRSLYQWLEGFKTHSVTISGASNTMLYLTKRVVSDPSLYDLSTLRVLLVGSEPVGIENVRNFQENYRLTNVVVPAYGLAEVALCATMHEPGTAAVTNTDGIVSCGTPLPGVTMRIAGGTVGEIQIKSPAAMTGYYKKPELTAEAFTDDNFVKTGDIGSTDDQGRYYIVGRSKNIIIHNGVNCSPAELESVAQKLSDVRLACVVGIANHHGSGREDIHLVVEVKKSLLANHTRLKELQQSLRRHAQEQCSYTPDKIHFSEPGTIPFSPNGKMQHVRMRELLNSPEFRALKTLCLEIV